MKKLILIFGVRLRFESNIDRIYEYQELKGLVNDTDRIFAMNLVSWDWLFFEGSIISG